jgi:hypothetical protein
MSRAWGLADVAAFRATLVTETTSDNEQLVRTYHPALRACSVVYVCESNFGPPVWVIRGKVSEVEAGGRDIHPYPVDHEDLHHFGILTPRSPWKEDYIFRRAINPRKFLTSEQLDGLREVFPKAIGARVLITGYLVILLPSLTDIEDTHKYDWVMEVGGLRVIYDVSTIQTTAETLSSGMEVAKSPNSVNGAGCLGLKLRMTDGSEAITTVTHGFVKLATPSRYALIFYHLMAKVKDALQRFRRPRPSETPAVGTSRDGRNNPVGKEVWLATEHRRVCASLSSALTYSNYILLGRKGFPYV